MTALFLPFESADTMDYILFFPSVVEQFVCTEKMDLQKLAAVVCSCFKTFVFGLVYECMK